jgi:hypothetical protein
MTFIFIFEGDIGSDQKAKATNANLPSKVGKGVHRQSWIPNKPVSFAILKKQDISFFFYITYSSYMK